MYPVVILDRNYKKGGTLGKLILPSGFTICSLERPWLNNKTNVSCIPEGIYHCKWIERSASGKYKKVWHVQNVPGRSGILFHVGNYIRHTLGCILPGMRHNNLSVGYSLTGLNKMRKELSGKDFTLLIISKYTYK